MDNCTCKIQNYLLIARFHGPQTMHYFPLHWFILDTARNTPTELATNMLVTRLYSMGTRSCLPYIPTQALYNNSPPFADWETVLVIKDQPLVTATTDTEFNPADPCQLVKMDCNREETEGSQPMSVVRDEIITYLQLQPPTNVKLVKQFSVCICHVYICL